MNQIIILDAATLAALGSLERCAELCDASGRTLDYFTPAPDRELYAEVEIPPIDEAELKRRETEDPTFTTAEVLEHLENVRSEDI